MFERQIGAISTKEDDMKFRQKVLSVAGAMVVGVTGLLATAPAQAGSFTVSYPAMPVDACQHQGHLGATTFTPWDPNGMICYDLGFPFGISFAEGLDYQGFCSWKYPGSYAENPSGSLLGWKCTREEDPNAYDWSQWPPTPDEERVRRSPYQGLRTR